MQDFRNENVVKYLSQILSAIYNEYINMDFKY